jgi:anti-sigma B factor antagonist
VTAAVRGRVPGLVIEDLGDLTLVTPAGALDVYAVAAFLRAVERRTPIGGRLVIDLGRITLLDSAGLAALVRLQDRAGRDRRSRLGLVCPRPRLRRVFEITRLRPRFLIAGDLQAVRAALSGQARTTARR